VSFYPTQSPKLNWVVVLISSGIIISVGMGIRQSFGLFLLPISDVLGEGRTLFSLAIALQNLTWGIAAPVFGAMADKYGPARVCLAGGLFYILGLLLMAGFLNPATLIIGQILVGMALASAGMSVALGAVAKVAPKEKTGIALGLVTAIGSFGQFMMLPFSQVLLSNFGWQLAYVVLAICIAFVTIFSFGLRVPKGQRTSSVELADTITAKQALSAAFKDKNYLLLTTGFFVCGLHVAFIATHLPTYIIDIGLSKTTGGWALALVGLFNIIGSFTAGYLGGKYSKKNLLSCIYLLRSIVIALFVFMPPSTFMALFFGAAIGLLWLGTVPLTSGLVVVFFGPKHVTMLYGMVFLSHQVGSFFGAWYAGYIYDSSGSYLTMWSIAISAGIFASAINFFIQIPKFREPAAA